MESAGVGGGGISVNWNGPGAKQDPGERTETSQRATRKTFQPRRYLSEKPGTLTQVRL